MLLSVQLHAQSVFPNFVRSYGGTDTEIPLSFISLPDSGYVISASTRSFGPGNTNIYIIRTNRNGDTLWTRVIGNGGESGCRVSLTSGQELILANTQTLLNGNGSNLMKLGLNGNVIWSKAYGGGDPDFIYDVKQTNDHGYIAVGNSSVNPAPYNDLFIMKTDSNGFLQWGRHFGGSNYEWGMSVVCLPGGGCLAAGSTSSYNGSPNNALDAMLLRTDNAGNLLWAKRYSIAPKTARGFKVLSLNDGGFLLTGLMDGSGSNNDIFLLRTDSLGNSLWAKQYIKAFSESIGNIISVPNNGFLISAQTASVSGADWDIYLIRTDSLGDTLWTRTLGGNMHDVARDVISIDGGYAILSQSASFNATGLSTDYDIALLFTDADGNSSCFSTPTDSMIVSNITFIEATFSPVVNTFCTMTTNGPPVISGGTVTDWCNSLGISSVAGTANSGIMVYPNPAKDFFNVECKIADPVTFILFNSLGKEIMKRSFNGFNQTDITALPNGIYFWQAISGNEKQVNGKLIVIK